MMKLFYSLLLLALSVSPARAMEYVNGVPQGGGAAIGSYEDVVALWTDCGSLFMKGDGTCSAGSIEESDPLFSVWDKSTGITITTDQITDITTYLTYADITALWTDCAAGVLMADGTCVVLGSAATVDITAFDLAGAAAAVAELYDTSAELQAIIGAGVYDASGAAAAIIAAAVTESDTTHCPDGASVFTALAGKQASGSYLVEEADPVCSAWDYADIVALWTACTGLLYSDGTCVPLDSFTEIDPAVGAITGIVKSDGAGNFSAASAGTDYQAPLTGGTDYLRPTTDVDDTPVDSETVQPVSSNWAFDHAAKASHLLWQSANVNPDSLYANEAGIFELAPKTPAALTVTEIYVALNEDPTNELTVTCWHKAAAIGYTGGTQIDTNDTVAGTFSATSAFDDATIPAGSKVWCVVVDNPDATTTHLGISLFGTWD